MGPWLVLPEHLVPKSPRQKWIETKESWERSRHIEVPAAVPAAPPRPGGLRIAFLVYRGNPRCGGQGVYTRHLTRELVALGHSVEVFAGPALARARRRSRLHAGRAASTSTASPTRSGSRSLASSRAGIDWARIRHHVHRRIPRAAGLSACGPGGCWPPAADEFDLVHDNQCLGNGMLGMIEDGWPLLTTLHHPITVDRQLALSHATNPWQRFTTRRWFGFLGMQVRVARALPGVRHGVGVVEAATSPRRCRSRPDRMTVVPVGVDHTVFRPRDDVTPMPGPDHGHLVVRRAR